MTSYLPAKVPASCAKLIRKLKLLEPRINWNVLLSLNALSCGMAGTILSQIRQTMDLSICLEYLNFFSFLDPQEKMFVKDFCNNSEWQV